MPGPCSAQLSNTLQGAFSLSGTKCGICCWLLVQATQQVIDVRDLLQGEKRAQRPKRIAVLLRGLPGSGKSHAARAIRDVEVASGGEAPRILSIDDYFVTVPQIALILEVHIRIMQPYTGSSGPKALPDVQEVEKEVVEEDAGGHRRKRRIQVVEYCYEASLEGAAQACVCSISHPRLCG